MADRSSIQEKRLALWRAIHDDRVDLVESSLAGLTAECSQSPATFDINQTDFDADFPWSGKIRTHRTLLYYCRSGPVAQLLLDSGAAACVRDKYGRTPLHVAAERQRTDVAR